MKIINGERFYPFYFSDRQFEILQRGVRCVPLGDALETWNDLNMQMLENQKGLIPAPAVKPKKGAKHNNVAQIRPLPEGADYDRVGGSAPLLQK